MDDYHSGHNEQLVFVGSIPEAKTTSLTEVYSIWMAYDGFDLTGKVAVIPCIPMRRWGSPEDFGAITVYLMNTTRYRSGDAIKIDGGFGIF